MKRIASFSSTLPLPRLRDPLGGVFAFAWPVETLVGGGCRSAHVPQLSCWIHSRNPLRRFVNRALQRVQFFRVMGAEHAYVALGVSSE